MTYTPRPTDFYKVVISEKPSGRLTWVRAKWATIQRFGWLEEFKTFNQHVSERHEDGLVLNQKASKPRNGGGRAIVVGRGRNHHRPGAGNRTMFRASSTCSLFDLAELAHFTKGDWDWMTTRAGVVRTRCEWEAIYNAAKF